MATNEEVLTPKVLIAPRVATATALTGAPVGTIVMSGAKLCVAVTAGVFETITST